MSLSDFFSHERQSKLSSDIRSWLIVVALLVFIAFGIYGLHAWTESSKMVGTTNAKANVVLDDFAGLIKSMKAKLDEVDVKNVNAVTEEGAARLRDLHEQQAALTVLINTGTNELRAISRGAQANLVSSKGLIDEGTKQVKANGDNLAKTILRADKLLADNTPQITDATTALARGMNGLATTIETSQPQVAEILSNLKAVTVDANGMIRAYTPIGTNLAGATDDFHKMTSDSQAYLHTLMFPPKVSGFWPNVWRGVKFVLQPAYDIGKLYFLIKRVP